MVNYCDFTSMAECVGSHAFGTYRQCAFIPSNTALCCYTHAHLVAAGTSRPVMGIGLRAWIHLCQGVNQIQVQAFRCMPAGVRVIDLPVGPVTCCNIHPAVMGDCMLLQLGLGPRQRPQLNTAF